MITQVRLKNFKCFKNVQVKLDPLTALVGENDTGKSAFLQAIKLVSIVGQLSRVKLSETGKYGLPLAQPVVWKALPDAKLTIGIAGEGRGEARIGCEVGGKDASFSFQAVVPLAEKTDEGLAKQKEAVNEATDTVSCAVGKAEYYAFRAEDLRKPSSITDTGIFGSLKEGTSMSPSGVGFPTFLEDLLRSDRKAFAEMEAQFNERFPDYHIELPKEKGNNTIVFRTSDGQKLPSENVSDGAMLFLAFLAVTHQPDPPRVLMIEEPENGVHHARLRDIVDALKNLVDLRKAQVLITTHSPYLLDLVEPENVRVFSKGKDGDVHVKKLSEYPQADQMKQHFMTGEIWTELSEEAQPK
ncbi:MAG: AAA family ATPase [Phycisphaerae bacterium]